MSENRFAMAKANQGKATPAVPAGVVGEKENNKKQKRQAAKEKEKDLQAQ